MLKDWRSVREGMLGSCCQLEVGLGVEQEGEGARSWRIPLAPEGLSCQPQ